MDSQVTAAILYQKLGIWSIFWNYIYLFSIIAIDKVARSPEPGKDQGCIIFDEVEYITEQERINALYKKYLNRFTTATAPLENIFTTNIDLYDCRIQVAHFPSTNMEINLFIETKGKQSLFLIHHLRFQYL